MHLQEGARRSNQGFWELVEAYVSRHTEAEFSHGICPECLQAFYPWYKNPTATQPKPSA